MEKIKDAKLPSKHKFTCVQTSDMLTVTFYQLNVDNI